MKVSVGLPTHEVDRADEFLGANAMAAMAREAETAGFDAVFVTEHPMPADAWLAHGGHHALDPMVALSFAAAATTRLRLQTNLFVPAYRNPFLGAKAIATLDAMSDGRVILGIGAGYLEDEFAALGVDFTERNDLTDEAIETMKAAWTGESITRTGRHFEAHGNTMLPRPVQRPHPPIWIGGNSRRAVRRAVELADGWCPMPSPAKASHRLHTPGMQSLDDLRAKLDYAREHAAAVGRAAPLEVVFMPTGLTMFGADGIDTVAVVDEIRQLAEAGVTYTALSLPASSRGELLERFELFGREVLPQVADV